MKRNLIIMLMFCWSIAYGQQNLFNIPSGDITPKKKIFFQQQINAYNLRQFESKSHFVYGLINNVDVGVNFINTPIEFYNGIQLRSNDNKMYNPLYPAILLTGQSQFKFSDYLKLNVGFMAGTNLSKKTTNLKPLYNIYGIFNFNISPHARLLVGPFYANKFLVGHYSNIGALVGYEIIITERIYLMGDYISGRNASSAAVVGMNYNLTKRVQLCSGFLLATPHKGIKPGLVFELNILGYDLTH